MLFIPILGGVIGFSTNILAILMIFRPHKPWRVFGVRVPLTPGLMPKEHGELARKIGEMLAEKILTRDTLVEAANSTHIVESIVNMVDKAVEGFVRNPKTLGELCAGLLNRDEGDIAKTAAEYALKGFGLAHNLPGGSLGRRAADYLRSEDFRRVAVDFCADFAEKAIRSDKKLGDFVPQGGVAALKAAIHANAFRLGPIVRRLLDDKAIDAALRGVAEKVVKANAGGLLGLFVRPNKIYDSVRDGLLEHLDSAHGQAALADKLCGRLDMLLDKDASSLADKLTRANTESWLTAAIGALQGGITDGHVENLKAKVQGVIEAHSPDVAQKMASGVLALVPADIFANVDYKTPTAAATRRLVGILADKAGEHIVGALDIAAIAEAKINAFSSKEVERLVLDVAGKHLKWIAMLGGVLGFIIGFLPGLLSG